MSPQSWDRFGHSIGDFSTRHGYRGPRREVAVKLVDDHHVENGAGTATTQPYETLCLAEYVYQCNCGTYEWGWDPKTGAAECALQDGQP